MVVFFYKCYHNLSNSNISYLNNPTPQPSMGDVIIFDFDGVILDSFPDQFRWFNHICDVLEKPFPYAIQDEFKEVYREPVYPDLYRNLGFDWEKEKDIIWQEYNKHKSNSAICLFDGIEEVIKDLTANGKTLAIASSNTHAAINKQLEDNRITEYFGVIVGKEDLPEENGEPLLKPHPVCLLLALEKLDCLPQEAVYVGDQPSDIIAARRVAEYRSESLPIVAVTYGYSSKEKMMEMLPGMIADSPGELLPLLKSNS